MQDDRYVGLNNYPDPPKQEYYTADCGCDVGYGDDDDEIHGEWGGVYEWEGRYICPDCMRDKIEEMSLKEKAELLWARFITLDDLFQILKEG